MSDVSDGEPAVDTDGQGIELVIGLVAAAGTDLDRVGQLLENTLETVNYTAKPIRLSGLLHEIPNPSWDPLPTAPEETRYERHMDAGNALRKALDRDDALALLAIGKIRDLRQKATGDANKPAQGVAYVLRSLKTPEEVETLRRVYGSRFVLIAAYSPRDSRVENLSRKIAGSHQRFSSVEFRQHAEVIVCRDESEIAATIHGQNVRETFPLADVFVDVTDVEKLARAIARCIEILFGHPFHTPNRDEYGMFHAQAAALRSASLGRQVGVAVTTEDGEIVAVGTNEVPKAGGGLYWSDDDADHRDHVLGYDPNDRLKYRLLADVLKRLQEKGWLSNERSTAEIDNLVLDALSGGPTSVMKGAQLMSILEFGRAVHAEMAALSNSARRGVAVGGCTLYSTTFPCHECARHIVAAGVRRVVYIEPYPKSLVPELYPDSVSVEAAHPDSRRIPFEPFVGVAPTNYLTWFTMTVRKDGHGNVRQWRPAKSAPRLVGDSQPATYLFRESGESNNFLKELRKEGLWGQMASKAADTTTPKAVTIGASTATIKEVRDG